MPTDDDQEPELIWPEPSHDEEWFRNRCAVLFRIEDRDPNTCGICGRPHGAGTEHECLNADGSSVYFREKYGTHVADEAG